MGTGSSTFTYQDGQYMAFNNYPLSKSKNKPLTCEQEYMRDPDGTKAKMRMEIRVAELKAKERYEKEFSK